MQLTKNSKLAEKLAIAATALIGSASHAQENESEWEYSISALAYSETDRVSAAEFILDATKNFSETSNLTYKFVIDSLTGSSANGAIEQNSPQTFTRPSGKGQFITDANSTVLDDTFQDTRVQFNISWTDALTEDSRYTVGSNLSKEYDFQSISLNGEWAKDFNQKNSTFLIGASVSSDQYDPEGGTPIGFTSMVVDNGQFASQDDFWTAFNATRDGSSDTITSTELLVGWTQVVNRKMLMQFNYGFANTDGYLTDPFKILSVIDNNGITQDLVYENRPDSKTQHSLFGMMKYHLDESVFDISYRYLTNDWEVKSHTIDAHWLFFANEGRFWQPHIRFYQQDAAEFYTPFLVQTDPLPVFASADYRVGEMTAVTLGLKYGFQMDDGDRAEIRLEYYKQTPNSANEPQGVANLEGLDLYPEIDAVILQFNYYF